MMGIAPLQGEIIVKQKYTEILKKKSSSPEPEGQIHSNLIKLFLDGGNSSFSNKWYLFKGEIITKCQKVVESLKKIFSRISGPEKLKFTRKRSDILQNQVCYNQGPRGRVEPQ
jgi:hypothetical protein